MLTAAFQSGENRAYLRGLCRRFLADRYDWEPPKNMLFDRLVDDVMTGLLEARALTGASLDEWNKRVVSAVKTRALSIAPLPMPPQETRATCGSGRAERGNW